MKELDIKQLGEVLESLGNFVNLTFFVDEDGKYSCSLGCRFDDALEEESEDYMMAVGYGLLASLSNDPDRLFELGTAMLLGMLAESEREEQELLFSAEAEEEDDDKSSKKDNVLSFNTKGTKTRH